MKYIALLSIIALLLLAGCFDTDKPVTERPDLPEGEEFLELHELYVSEGSAITIVEPMPDAYSEQFYEATLKPVGGVGPYTCEQFGDDGVATSEIRVSEDCLVSGIALYVSEQWDASFMVNITEANGEWVVYQVPFTFRPGNPLKFTLPRVLESKAPREAYYSFDFCDPPGQKTCGTAENQVNPSGGSPPYGFFALGYPEEYTMNLNGVLAGILPKMLFAEGYRIRVCARDTTGLFDCAETIFYISNPIQADEIPFVEAPPPPDLYPEEEEEDEEEGPGGPCSPYIGVWEGELTGQYSNADGESVSKRFDMRLELACPASASGSDAVVNYPEIVKATISWPALGCTDGCVPTDIPKAGQIVSGPATLYMNPDSRAAGIASMRFKDAAEVVYNGRTVKPSTNIDFFMNYEINKDGTKLTSKETYAWIMARNLEFVCPGQLDISDYCEASNEYARFEGDTHDCCVLDSSSLILRKVA